MDADTRHHLKQNELAEALARLRNFNDPRLRWVLLGVALLAVLLLAFYMWRGSQRRATADSWQRLTRIVQENLTFITADKLPAAQDALRTLIDETSDPTVVAYARLNLARAYSEQALLDPTQRPKGFEEAARILEQVRDDPSVGPVARAPALFALASAYESLRTPDKAEDIYNKLTTDAAYDGSPYKTLAARRLADMDAGRTTIAFAPGMAPTTPTTDPAQMSEDEIRRYLDERLPTPMLPPDMMTPPAAVEPSAAPPATPDAAPPAEEVPASPPAAEAPAPSGSEPPAPAPEPAPAPAPVEPAPQGAGSTP